LPHQPHGPIARLRTTPDCERGEALARAGATGLRPILMTTLCTLFGLLPLALGLGAGAELQKPLAIAVIGGLSVSTVVTLVFVPTLLSILPGRPRATSD
jgi:hydrophobic/amphiphilic exporter-1 (mainly G- bacteria), HAE1 family